MTDINWKKPRRITIVVDNDSWILPYAETLTAAIRDGGDNVSLARTHAQVGTGEIAFYLGCVHITPPDVLARNARNIVVHASDLPKGRGFAPVAWQILEGANDIPVCLLEMAEAADAGPVIFRETMRLEGHELYGEWRAKLGALINDMCLRYLNAPVVPVGIAQAGEATAYRRRRPEDSILDPEQTIAAQFDLMRVVDNENYPAFFNYRGKKYIIRISKAD